MTDGTPIPCYTREGGREGGREREREGGREGGREGKREVRNDLIESHLPPWSLSNENHKLKDTGLHPPLFFILPPPPLGNLVPM